MFNFQKNKLLYNMVIRRLCLNLTAMCYAPKKTLQTNRHQHISDMVHCENNKYKLIAALAIGATGGLFLGNYFYLIL